jgi:hypothetical protein
MLTSESRGGLPEPEPCRSRRDASWGVDVPEDDNEFIEGLRELVDEAIDCLQMHIHYLPGSDADSKALAQSYLHGVVDFIRDAEAWAERFSNRNAEPS